MPGRLCQSFHSLSGFGQEFVQWRINQSDSHRPSAQGLIHGGKVLALHGQEGVESFLTFFFVCCHYHPSDGLDAIGLEEHMLGAAQADSLSTQLL